AQQLSDGVERVRIGSLLAMRLESARFDFVASIGCLHHIGNLKRVIAEVHRVLKNCGVVLLMIYNALSFTRGRNFPGRSRVGYGGSDEPLRLLDTERQAYDTNSAGKSSWHPRRRLRIC